MVPQTESNVFSDTSKCIGGAARSGARSDVNPAHSAAQEIIAADPQRARASFVGDARTLRVKGDGVLADASGGVEGPSVMPAWASVPLDAATDAGVASANEAGPEALKGGPPDAWGHVHRSAELNLEGRLLQLFVQGRE